MVPKIGMVVIVRGVHSNGAAEAPAIITRAWSGRDTREGAVAVNLAVFPDAAPPRTHTSVMLFETQLQACEYRGANPQALAAHWPLA